MCPVSVPRHRVDVLGKYNRQHNITHAASAGVLQTRRFTDDACDSRRRNHAGH